MPPISPSLFENCNTTDEHDADGNAEVTFDAPLGSGVSVRIEITERLDPDELVGVRWKRLAAQAAQMLETTTR